MKRTVYFISDRTGISAEVLGHSLLSQFEQVEFTHHALPFVDSVEKAEKVVTQINERTKVEGSKPIIFDTIIDAKIRAVFKNCDAFVMDYFQTFIGPLEQELGVSSSFTVGKTHSTYDPKQYEHRINAINFALNNDDGAITKYYNDAEIILVGVSRCGKTPTSLYLSMQFGIMTANYPFIPDDLGKFTLPDVLMPHRKKLFGLTINADRLHAIRSNRRANSQYAALRQCQLELREVESLYRRYKIPFINTSTKSVEEISTKILAETGLQRRLY